MRSFFFERDMYGTTSARAIAICLLSRTFYISIKTKFAFNFDA